MLDAEICCMVQKVFVDEESFYSVIVGKVRHVDQFCEHCEVVVAVNLKGLLLEVVDALDAA